MGPFDCLYTVLSHSADNFSLPVFNYLTDKRIILFHFSQKHRPQLTKSLFYEWKARIFMQDLQTDISGQTESNTDGLVLYLLKDLKCGVWEMHIRNTAIFKDGPDVYFVKS